jgi:prepilin-type N-terminal cleavage/methylation domain-containing protein
MRAGKNPGAPKGSAFTSPADHPGFSLIEVLISLAIMTALTIGIFSLATLPLRIQKQSNMTFQADILRRSIVSALNSPKSWQATVTDPRNNRTSKAMLDCVPTNAPGNVQAGYLCTTDGITDIPAGTPITARAINVVVDAAGGTVYDASKPNYGLSPQGLICKTFVDPKNGPGDDNCPLRFNVFWSAICSTTCVNPQIQLQVVAVFNPGVNTRVPFNTANYSTPLFMQGTGSAGGSCWTMGANGSLIDTCPGKVGIWSATPSSALEVDGAITVNTLPANDFALVQLQGKSNGTWYSVVNLIDPLNNVWGLQHMANGHFVISRYPTGHASIDLDGVNGAISMAGTVSINGVPLGVSDARLKKGIRPLEGSLDRVLKLQGVSYQWKEPERYAKGQQIGLIAQEVEKVFPELVATQADGGIKSVDYPRLAAPIIESIKSVYKGLVSQQSKVEQQAGEIAAAKSELAAQKSEMSAVRAKLAENEAALAALRSEVAALKALVRPSASKP